MLPSWLTPAVVIAAAWVELASGELLAGILPAAVVIVSTALDYALWLHRGRPWHDWAVILLLLPAIAGAVWIAVGGLVTGVERGDAGRLAVEVGPGVALVGLLCTLVSYHGRHHPDEFRAGAAAKEEGP